MSAAIMSSGKTDAQDKLTGLGLEALTGIGRW